MIKKMAGLAVSWLIRKPTDEIHLCNVFDAWINWKMSGQLILIGNTMSTRKFEKNAQWEHSLCRLNWRNPCT